MLWPWLLFPLFIGMMRLFYVDMLASSLNNLQKWIDCIPVMITCKGFCLTSWFYKAYEQLQNCFIQLYSNIQLFLNVGLDLTGLGHHDLLIGSFHHLVSVRRI